MAVNGGRGSSAGWRQSPYAKAWPPALHSAAFAPQTSDSTLHTSPPHSFVEKKKGMQTKKKTASELVLVTLQFFCHTLRNQGSATGFGRLTVG